MSLHLDNVANTLVGDPANSRIQNLRQSLEDSSGMLNHLLIESEQPSSKGKEESKCQRLYQCHLELMYIKDRLKELEGSHAVSRTSAPTSPVDPTTSVPKRTIGPRTSGPAYGPASSVLRRFPVDRYRDKTGNRERRNKKRMEDLNDRLLFVDRPESEVKQPHRTSMTKTDKTGDYPSTLLSEERSMEPQNVFMTAAEVSMLEGATCGKTTAVAGKQDTLSGPNIGIERPVDEDYYCDRTVAVARNSTSKNGMTFDSVPIRESKIQRPKPEDFF